MSAVVRLGLIGAAALLAVGLGAALGLALPELRDGDAGGHTAATAHAHEGPARGTGAPAAGLAVTADGMTLAPVSVALAPAGSRFAFRVLDEDGRAITDLDLAHERRMHLVVVRRDLGHYAHVHPAMGTDGTWAVRLDLPAGGVYRAYADFVHDGARVVLATDLFVDGPMRAAPLPPAGGVASGDGYRADLVVRDADGALEALTYAVTRSGRPVAGITPYLGASAHVVAIREGDMAYAHAHAEDAAPRADRLQVTLEPPSAGRYRVFIQFRHDGAVRTVAHTLAVRR